LRDLTTKSLCAIAAKGKKKRNTILRNDDIRQPLGVTLRRNEVSGKLTGCPPFFVFCSSATCAFNKSFMTIKT
jgi:hypothetical protein